eukprot:2620887-Rhodomonas_salina.2
MVYYKRAPNVKMIRTFGCHSVLHFDKDAVSDGALSDRGIEGIFLGLSSSEGRKAYSVWCPHNNYVYYGTNVTFDETRIPLLEGGNKDHKTDLSDLFLEQVQTTTPAQIQASAINDLLTPKTADTERSEARGSAPDYTPQRNILSSQNDTRTQMHNNDDSPSETTTAHNDEDEFTPEPVTGSVYFDEEMEIEEGRHEPGPAQNSRLCR